MNSDEAVVQAQDIVAGSIASCVHKKSEFYNDVYRPTERNYWTHIPAWIEQDWSTTPPSTVMDVGGAYGTLAVTSRLLFPGARVTIVDRRCYVFPVLLEQQRLEYRMADLRSAPRPPQGVDVLICTEVLEHLPSDPCGALQALRGLLSGRGRLYLSTPDSHSAWGRVTGQPLSWRDMPPYDADVEPADAHAYQYDEDELRDLVRAAGLRVVRYDRSSNGPYLHQNLTLEAPCE